LQTSGDTEHGHFCLLADAGFVADIVGVFYYFFPRFFGLNSVAPHIKAFLTQRWRDAAFL